MKDKINILNEKLPKLIWVEVKIDTKQHSNKKLTQESE
jgi:hypothetical protein